MTVDTILIEKREDLKHRLAGGEYRTLIDIFLAWTNRLFRKTSHKSKPLPLWFITVFWTIVVDLITFGPMYIAGDSANLNQLSRIFRLEFHQGILVLASLHTLTMVTVIVINQSLHRICVLWHDGIVDATGSITSLREFEGWLATACNIRQHLLVTILGGLLLGLGIMLNISSLLGGMFLGYAFTFGIIISDVITAALAYQLLVIILLPIMLHRYDLRLFKVDPATSELLSRLSGELGFFVYYVAVYAALVTLVYSLPGSLATGSILLVLSIWLPIIAMFALNQIALSSIIRRAKWRTLNEIQARVEKLQTAENLEAKETMDAINRLLDYHERVNKTRSSALDFRASLSLINSLLLPLLAFLLGNLDEILVLLKIKP